MSSATAQPQRGLYQDRGFLVIDYENQPVYPPRCMFTNEPITGLTRLKVSFVNMKGRRPITIAANMLVGRDSIDIDLPISEKWKGQRDVATEWWGKQVWKVGLLAWIPMIACFVAGSLIGNAHPAGLYLAMAGGLLSGVAIVATAVGALWPYIEVPTSSAAIQGARHMPPHVWIQNVHPEFLKALPKFQNSQVTLADMLFGR